MEDKQIVEIKDQLTIIANSFNGYNGEVLLRGIKTRLEMSGAIDKEMVVNPQTGNVSHDDAEKLLLIVTDIFKNSRLSNGDSQ